MGNQCQLCVQGPMPTTQILPSNYIRSDDEYVTWSMPIDDPFFISYLNQKEWAHYQKVLKKNTKFNRFYYGDWLKGVPEGKGIFYEPNVILLDSFYLNGVAHGMSKVIFIDKNSQYKGLLLEGRFHGQGTLVDYKQMYNFTGVWSNSIPKRGVLTLFKDTNIDKIEFVDFEQRKAKIHYRDGRLYDGEIDCKKLIPNGKGKVTFSSFDVKDHYQGEWKNGLYHGLGAFYWKNGQNYVGHYTEGQKHGIGKFKFMSGVEYQGNWAHGKQHGIGSLYDQNGFVLKQGMWNDGVFVGSDRFHNSHIRRNSSLNQVNYENSQKPLVILSQESEFNQGFDANRSIGNYSQFKFPQLTDSIEKKKDLTMANILRDSRSRT